MSTVLLDTTDIGEAEHLLSANFGRTQLGRHPDSQMGRTRVRRTAVGSLNVDDFEFACDLSIHSDALDLLYLARVRSGLANFQPVDREELVLGPDHVGVCGGAKGDSFSGRVQYVRGDVLSMGRRVLSEVASGPGDAPVRLIGMAPVSAEANLHLVRVVDHVRHSVADDPEIALNPLIASGIQRYLAASILAALPSTALLAPTIEDRRDSTPQLLRRAIAFIDDNAHTNISLADIASAVFVTPRALQYMFRKHRDITPTEYLRQVRLHQAHLDLLAGNQDTTSVSEIARKWGFAHLGRFASHYRQLYDQSPHVTLRS